MVHLDAGGGVVEQAKYKLNLQLNKKNIKNMRNKCCEQSRLIKRESNGDDKRMDEHELFCFDQPDPGFSGLARLLSAFSPVPGKRAKSQTGFLGIRFRKRAKFSYRVTDDP